MNLGDRLQRWLDRVRGHEAPAAKPVHRAAGQIAGPDAARPGNPLPGTDDGESLRLSVADEPAQPPRRRGTSGFDPYSNSAGYRKPRGWDDVPRR